MVREGARGARLVTLPAQGGARPSNIIVQTCLLIHKGFPE
jgi:hypothetical protein